MSQSLSSLASLLKENVRAGVADVAFRRTDFLNILGDAGRVEEILADFPIPELGIYAMLPSNRHVPYRVRALMDFLAVGLAS